jgi:SAM-dependent methyltransferase
LNVVSRPIEAAVADYYTRALDAHGPTPRGVDWSSAESQEMRFGVLLDSVDWTGTPSVLDYGCGYGALGAWIDRLGHRCRYVGYDVASAMIDAARAADGDRGNRSFTAAVDELEPADYVVASGIFNVKLETPVATWEAYVEDTLRELAGLAKRSLSFNMLPLASPSGLARPDLYYAEPGVVARRCEELLGGTVELREGYGLWEFTVTVS